MLLTLLNTARADADRAGDTARIAANAAVSYPLPRNYRLAWTIGGTTPSFTFSVGAQYVK